MSFPVKASGARGATDLLTPPPSLTHRSPESAARLGDVPVPRLCDPSAVRLLEQATFMLQSTRGKHRPITDVKLTSISAMRGLGFESHLYHLLAG